MHTQNELIKYEHCLVPGFKVQDTLTNEELIFCVNNNISPDKAKLYLVKNNHGLVYTEAKKCTAIVELDDLIQYGYEALLRSIVTFKLEFNVKFSTFATNNIRRFLYRKGNDENTNIPVPEHLSIKNTEIQRYINDYMSKHGERPSIENISKVTGHSESTINNIIDSKQMTFISSISSHDVDSDESLSMFDVVMADDRNYRLDENSFDIRIEDAINMVMDELTHDEYELLSYVYGLNDYPIVSYNTLCEGAGYMFEGTLILNRKTLTRKGQAILNKIKVLLNRKKIAIDFTVLD